MTTTIANYTTVEEAREHIRHLQVEVCKINQQLDDFQQLLENQYLEIQVDEEWILKAQTARRHKRAEILEAELWIGAQTEQPQQLSVMDADNNQNVYAIFKAVADRHDKDINRLQNEINGLKNSLKKEREKRAALQETVSEQRRFTLRCIYEIIKTIPSLLNESNLNLNSLSWIPTQMSKNQYWGLAKNVLAKLNGSEPAE